MSVIEKNTTLSDFNLGHRAYKNLGTFSTTHMDKNVKKVFFEYAAFNGIDSVAYPELSRFEEECGKFMLGLAGAGCHEDYQYYSTSGSSEAIFMSLAFMKYHWELKNLNHQEKPNIVIGTHAHVAWLKAAAYLGVESRTIPLAEKLELLDSQLYGALDHNTIGLGCTLGVTTTLAFDNIKNMDHILKKYHKEKNHFIPIHVDAASGGFIAPFYYPELSWNFELDHVVSINISSHKFGMIYPSLGWLLLRKNTTYDNFLHDCDYLGKTIKRYPVRFSHSASHVAAQYYTIKQLGHRGYKNSIYSLFRMTKILKNALLKYDEIQLIEPLSAGRLPGIVFTIENSKSRRNLRGLSLHLKEAGWHLPVFSLPSLDGQNQAVSRIVVRYGLDEKWMKMLLNQMECYFLN